MGSWKVRVEDYGKIKSAEIEMAPLTLFVGDNNSGKSYLLALLWGIENLGVGTLVGRDYVDEEETHVLAEWLFEQIECAVKQKQNRVSVKAIIERMESLLNKQLEKQKNVLAKGIFNSENVKIGKLTMDLSGLSERYVYFEADVEAGKLSMQFAGRHKYGFSKGFMDQNKLRKETQLQWGMIRALYGGVMDLNDGELQESRVVYLPAARTGFMLTKDIINKVGRNSTFNLADESETITPFIRPINRFLDTIEDLSVDAVGDKKYIGLAAAIEREMTDGTVEFSTMPNKEVLYVPNGFKKGIPLRLSSAVVTELAPFILILKHRKHVKRFYYEEPEMCLHLQLQYKMGKIIGQTVNAGINMVITTHSDLILQHINNMIRLAVREEREEICREFAYTGADMLSCEQVKVYQLKAKTRGKTEVEELPCGENGFSVPTFNDALDEIMDTAYRIQG